MNNKAEKWLRKTGGSKSRTQARAEIGVSAPDMSGGREETTCVLLGVDNKTWESEDVSWTPATKM